MRTHLGLSLVVVCLVAALGSAAQNQKVGEIAGVIQDAQGAPLPGVSVSLTGPETRRTVTDGRGEFRFAAVLPGAYQLRFSLAGFVTQVTPVAVADGAVERVSLRMALASIQEVVTVTGASGAAPKASAPADAQLRSGIGQIVAGGVGYGGAPHAPPPSAIGNAGDYPTRRPPFNTEAYDHIDENPFRRVAVDPLSTFSIDVDTASYSNMRRFLNAGQLPPAGAVRIEELINYFRFDYAQPGREVPFSVTTEVAECPWNPKHRLALIGLQGRAMPREELPQRNLVFLLDVSGSMMSPDKLPLVRTAMRMLVDTLDARDRVAIVVYAGSTGLVLPSTPGDRKADIHRAIEQLEAGGSTNGGAGIQLAYKVAREHFVRGGVNRVILATDGDFNVGVTSQDELIRLIEEQRASGVFLSVLGVGTGNLKDSTMEKLADKGNGNYAYLDSLHEARKVLVQEAGATLITIAKDVKIQVEFNPRAVNGYRLIGYENRILRHEDFNDDKKDAGEIGAGHSVTALYEIVPAGVEMSGGSVDPLKYQTPASTTSVASSDELLTVKLRYKAPDGDESRLIAHALRNRPQPMAANIGFASAVAEVGMLLRASPNGGSASYDAAVARARTFRQDDANGYRAEFIKLAELAASLSRMRTGTR